MWRTVLLAFGVGTVGLVLVLLGGHGEASAGETGQTYPCRVEGTSLEAVTLGSYEGPFGEDGTDDYVADTAALLIRNIGSCPVRDGEVTVCAGDKTYCFRFSWLLPGQSVLVPERDKQCFTAAPITACRGWTVAEEGEPLTCVTAQVTGMGELTILNSSASVIPRVRIYYKRYDPDSGMYTGGFTFCLEVQCLRPGEERKVYPPNFAMGSSQVVWITE